MQSVNTVISDLNGESGHALPALGALIAGAGIVGLGIGAATDNDWLACGGGIVGGVGVLAAYVLDHKVVSWKVFARLESLEGKNK